MSEKLLPTEIDLSPFEPALFAAMRRLQQAGEVHAKRLARFGGLTPMQLMILRVMEGEGRMTASGLSRRVSLSAATLSGMLERLEERGLLLRMRGFLHYRPVPCRCHLEYQRSPVRRIYVGYISFSRQRRRIFPSVLDAQAALFAKGWNPDKFQIVEEETNPKSEIQ